MEQKRKIKLVFGENGAGKSLYYEQKSKDSDFITLNYDIENWYNDKNISQEKYLNKKLNTEITEIANKIYKNKEIFGTIKSPQWKKFLEKINFESTDSWYKFSKENNHENVENYELVKIETFINILENFNKYKKDIQNLNDEQFELLKIYNSLKFNEIKKLKTNKAIEYQKNILELKNNISKEIEIILSNKDLNKLDIEMLDNIRNNDFNIEKLSKIIKLKIVNSDDCQKIFKNKEEMENNRKKSLNFIKYKEEIKKYNSNYKVSDDGYSILDVNLDKENFSNGQKIICIFELLFKCFAKSRKTIILDDVFEKLDILNTVKLLNLIFDEYLESNFNIEILTHDENFIELFNKILFNRDDIDKNNIEENIIFIDKNKKPIIKHKNLSLTFDNYIKNVYKNCLKQNNLDVH